MRRFWIITGAVLAGVVVALALLPWWLGAALRPVAARAGATFSRYERIGYTRFALHDVAVDHAQVRVRAERVELDTPLLWVWRHLTGKAAPIVAGEWRVDVRAASGPKPAPDPDAGWMTLRATLENVAHQLDRWASRIEAGAGRVGWPGGEISVASATWADRDLRVRQLRWRNLDADGGVNFGAKADEPLRLELVTRDEKAHLALRSEGATIDGELRWRDQAAMLRAAFGARGWRPESAEVRAANWEVAASDLRLGEYYGVVRGDVRIAWRVAQFEADVSVHAEPQAGKRAPALAADLHARGDGETFTIERLHAALPGFATDLDRPVVVTRRGEMPSGPANFTWRADLAQQPWFKASGVAEGHALVAPGASVGAAPQVSFDFKAGDLAAAEWKVADASAKGTLTWPRLEIAEARVALSGDDRASVRGAWDFATQRAEGVAIEGEFGSAAIARWLPDGVTFERARVTARVSGAAPAWTHEGKIELTEAAAPRVRPLALTLTWRGEGERVTAFAARGETGTAHFAATGAVDREGLVLQTLELAPSRGAALHLAAPATVRWRPRLEIAGLRLAGTDAQLDVNARLGAEGAVQITANHVDSAWVGDFVVLPGPAWSLRNARFDGTWKDGPMQFTAGAEAEVVLDGERRAGVGLKAKSDAGGVRIESLQVTQAGQAVVRATARLPIEVTPGAAEIWRVDEKGAVALDAETTPDAAFWAELRDASGLVLEAPAVRMHVEGEWNRPRGTAEVQVAKIAAAPGWLERDVPAVGPLHLRLTGDADAVRLERFSVAVEGQNVSAEGNLPLGDWAALRRAPLAYLREKAELHVVVAEAEMAPLVRFLPEVLAPKGRLQADFRFTPGGTMQGALHLQGLATRPVGGVGVVQDIAADVRLAGHAVEVESVTGRAGGQAVTVSGRVELPNAREPRYDLKLRGENLPFVRTMGLLVRGNLELTLTSPERGGAPQIGGKVVLRDSLFLSDVRAMIPGGPRGPAQRPPYFAVETEPFRKWTLAVDVRGERFLRLRTPVFNGVASTHLQLKGTLGDPRLSGDATVDEGEVRLPFAMFSVEQGRVSLRDQPPFEPELHITATSRRYDYDLRMEVGGTASAPNVVFSSSPPLDSEQILLLVMAGEVPNRAITMTDRQRVTRLGTFVGQSLFGSAGGDSGFADRLNVTSGEQVSQQGRETYAIEYRLNDRWSLVGEYDEFDDYNAGVKWRVLGQKPGRSAADKEDHGK